MNPVIQVAVRDEGGKAHLFRVQADEVSTHQQAIHLARQVYPQAKVILASVPAGEV